MRALLLAFSLVALLLMPQTALATQTQFTIPARNFGVGTTVFQQALPAGSIHAFSVSSDASLWTQPGTVEIEIDSSFDNGASYHHTTSVFQNAPPPWPADHNLTTSLIEFSTDYGKGVSPTNVQLKVTVTGQTVRLGPTVVTVN